jgi:hypothetical protein
MIASAAIGTPRALRLMNGVEVSLCCRKLLPIFTESNLVAAFSSCISPDHVSRGRRAEKHRTVVDRDYAQRIWRCEVAEKSGHTEE